MSDVKEEVKEAKTMEESILDRLEKNAVEIAMLKGQLNNTNAIALELSKECCDETLAKFNIPKQPTEPKPKE